MKITITQIVLDFELPEQEEPVPVYEPNPFDTLLAWLTRETKDERKTWEADPYGTIFKV